MRRHLHIAVALVTFACGFVVSGATKSLPSGLAALLVASMTPALWRRLRRAGCDAHRLKVVAFTFLFCLAPLSFFAAMLAPPRGDCFFYASGEHYAAAAGGEEAPAGDETGVLCDYRFAP